MNTTRLPLALAAIALSVQGHATVLCSDFNPNCKIFNQASLTVDGGVEVGEVDTTKLTAKVLLELLEIQLGLSFPNGAKIQLCMPEEPVFLTGAAVAGGLSPIGGSQVVDKKGVVIVDTSAFITNELDLANSLFDGKYDIVTGQEKSKIYFPVTVFINLPTPGLNLILGGLGVENFKANKPKNGEQKLKGNITADVSGEGALEGDQIYADGTIKLKGKDVVPAGPLTE